MINNDYKFDSRLAFGATLPSAWYFDAEMLAQEQRQIFAGTWQLVGRLEQLTQIGSYFTATIGYEPIVVVRGKDGQIRAFSNVCRHRAGAVAVGTGQRSSLQCNYHGWTYSLEGKLRQTPEFEGVECFNKADVCLPEFRVETWGNLVFANINLNAPALKDYLADLPSLINQDKITDYRWTVRKDWQLDCNWKVYVDNYLEGYHIPIVHPGLNRELDYNQYRTETKRYYSIQHTPIKPVVGGRLVQTPESDQAQYFWIFPNLMLNVYPDNYSTNLIVPISPTRTLTIFEWFFKNPTDPQIEAEVARVVGLSDEVQYEDIAICETVQRNLQSSTYTSGRYSVKRENGVHHFHSLMAEFLGLPTIS